MGIRSPVDSTREVRPGLVQARAEADVDAAPAQLVDRVVGERLVDLRQDAVQRLDQDPAHAVEPRARIAVDRVGGEVLELGERLQPRVAAADEHVGQELVAPAGVLGLVRPLERLDHVVSQPDRVGEALEPDRMLVEARDGQRPRNRPDGDEELVVADLLVLALVRGQSERPRLRIVRAHGAEPQVCPAQDVAQRRDDVARLQHAGGRLRQERRVEHEVDVVDERQPGRLARQDVLELARRGHPRESTTGNHDVPGHDLIMTRLVTTCYKVTCATIRCMDVRVADNPEKGRFELFADDELAGSAYYRMEDGAIAFTHTEVDDAYEGQGLGSKLASAALDEVRSRGLAVRPYCRFIRGYIERHPEYIDLVPGTRGPGSGYELASGPGLGRDEDAATSGAVCSIAGLNTGVLRIQVDRCVERRTATHGAPRPRRIGGAARRGARRLHRCVRAGREVARVPVGDIDAVCRADRA